MTDKHDIIVFSSDGEKILGVVVDHYSNPLDDFYVVYADYALHKTSSPDEDSSIIMDNVIIPACDEAIAEYRLKRQHLRDVGRLHEDVESLIEAIRTKMDIGMSEDSI